MARKSDAPTAKPETKPEVPYDRCAVVADDRPLPGDEVRRCWFPATIFDSVRGAPGTGECRLHHRVRGRAVLEVIEESERWRAARAAGADVPLEYTRADGRKVPGFPSLEQRDRAERAKLQSILPAGARS